MSIPDLLQFANVLIVPAFGYIIVLERRLMKLETMLSVKLDSLPCNRATCNN